MRQHFSLSCSIYLVTFYPKLLVRQRVLQKYCIHIQKYKKTHPMINIMIWICYVILEYWSISKILSLAYGLMLALWCWNFKKQYAYQWVCFHILSNMEWFGVETFACYNDVSLYCCMHCVNNCWLRNLL